MLNIERPANDKRSNGLTAYAGVTLVTGINSITDPEQVQAILADKRFQKDRKDGLIKVKEVGGYESEPGAAEEEGFDQAKENAKAVGKMKVPEATEYVNRCLEARTLFAIWQAETNPKRKAIRTAAEEQLKVIYGRDLTQAELEGALVEKDEE